MIINLRTDVLLATAFVFGLLIALPISASDTEQRLFDAVSGIADGFSVSACCSAVTGHDSLTIPPTGTQFPYLTRTKMTITHQDELDCLKKIGRIVANTMHAMAKASLA